MGNIGHTGGIGIMALCASYLDTEPHAVMRAMHCGRGGHGEQPDLELRVPVPILFGRRDHNRDKAFPLLFVSTIDTFRTFHTPGAVSALFGTVTNMLRWRPGELASGKA